MIDFLIGGGSAERLAELDAFLASRGTIRDPDLMAEFNASRSGVQHDVA